MKDNKGHIKAFTLMDVLAGMVIITIIVVMVFGIFNNVNQRTHEFQKMQVELNDFKILSTDLNREVDRCEMIYEVPNGFVLESKQSSLTYVLAENQLERRADESRNIIHPTVNKLEYEYLASKSDAQMISDIHIETDYRGQKLTAHFHKDYGIAQEINLTLLNVD